MKEYFTNGYVMIDAFYTKDEISCLLNALEKHRVFSYEFSDISDHNLFRSIPEVRQVAEADKLLNIAKTIIGSNARAFYSIILDKTKHSNWELDWHQDLKIAVKTKKDTPGYYGWSDEMGIPHVIPPVEILQKMLTVRIHLDDCDPSNGAIYVVPQSQKQGIIPQKQIEITSQALHYEICEAKAGSIMLMSPLLLHKSPYSESGKSRRILQVEYRAAKLENGLEWYN